MKNNTATLNILHIASHLGGGVGKALSSIVTYEAKICPDHKHKILLLDKPEKQQFLDFCRQGGVEVILRTESLDLIYELETADIVIFHWWHHPVMAEFFYNFPKVFVRIILWCHVNGCNYPILPVDFVSLPHKTFFTTPFSYENPFWPNEKKAKIKNQSTVVYGLGQLDFYKNISKKANENFVVGYVGTLSKSKLHPQFVDYCYAVYKKIPNVCFVMVGDTDAKSEILQKAKEYNIEDKFKFVGYSHHVIEEMSKFDVFAYPLNPKHFGTTENVLLEAMAFGLPVVVLNHNAEKYIIKNHIEVGLIADNIEHYAECLKYLYDNPKERIRIGNNAKEYVVKNFTFDKNVEIMRKEFIQVMNKSKRIFDFVQIFGNKPYEWFLSCLGEDEKIFRESIDSKTNDKTKQILIENKIRNSSPILKEKSKSSIRHFAKVFPNDLILKYWNSLLH